MTATPAPPGLPADHLADAKGPAPLGDRCPRCGGSFSCGMSGPAPCACTTVKLSASTLAALNRRWQHCLCLGCLQALAAGAPLTLPD